MVLASFPRSLAEKICRHQDRGLRVAATRPDRPLWFQIRSAGELCMFLAVVIVLSPLWIWKPEYTILDLAIWKGLLSSLASWAVSGSGWLPRSGREVHRIADSSGASQKGSFPTTMRRWGRLTRNSGPASVASPDDRASPNSASVSPLPVVSPGSPRLLTWSTQPMRRNDTNRPRLITHGVPARRPGGKRDERTKGHRSIDRRPETHRAHESRHRNTT